MPTTLDKSTERKPNEPYCGHCGYSLLGLTESSKCPECGKSIVEVLQRGSLLPFVGSRYRSETTVFGLPLIAVANGPSEDGSETRGHAVGVFAFGDSATGVFAFGGIARGVVAVGGLAIGGVSIGGAGVGAITAIGGLAVGGLAIGGGALGLVASGGGALGLLADGGFAVGWLARGGAPFGTHTIGPSGASPEAAAAVAEWDWLIGPNLGSSVLWLNAAAAAICASVIAAAVVLLGWLLGGRRPSNSTSSATHSGGSK